jgi:CRISPR-associated Csx2 family protein
MTTLISFLGKSQTGGYRKTSYRFESGVVREELYFGMALMEQLKVQRLVLVGTAGSMWNAFFLDRSDGDDMDALDRLDRAASEGAVTAEMLQGHAARLSAHLGIQVQCLLIGYAKSDEEQADLLLRLAGAVNDGEHVVLDVTHSFRHLPMLALVAARYLSKARGVCVDDIYYGAAEMRDPVSEEAPVLRLKGMLTMLDWVDALATYDKDGDYGVFAPLLQADGMDRARADQLARAAFFERTSNAKRAFEELSSVTSSVEVHPGPLGRLFRSELLRRIGWIRNKGRAAQERALATAYLERQDHLRAAIFLQESHKSAQLSAHGKDVDWRTSRDSAHESLRSQAEYADLSNLRNAMAHGDQAATDKAVEALGARDKLGSALRRIMNWTPR